MEDKKTAMMTEWELNLKQEDFKDICTVIKKVNELPTWTINVLQDTCNAIISLRLDGID